jgi:hypothetical protein
MPEPASSSTDCGESAIARQYSLNGQMIAERRRQRVSLPMESAGNQMEGHRRKRRPRKNKTPTTQIAMNQQKDPGKRDFSSVREIQSLNFRLCTGTLHGSSTRNLKNSLSCDFERASRWRSVPDFGYPNGVCTGSRASALPVLPRFPVLYRCYW